jgi:non-canonical purine NTP pyrophosphatase (RdgB/HAM1 family)
MMAHELYYVTGNAGKFEEVSEFIKRRAYGIVLKQADLDLEEIQTLDQKGIAIRKAQQAWSIVKKPLLVDDAGIYFEQYHRFPGTLTKFVYEGIGWQGILKLMSDDHRATFLLYLVYCDGPDSYQVFEGTCPGKIVEPKEFIAHPGLPYDDLFVPNGTHKTYAQMRGTQELDQYAYRLLAVEKFLTWYQKIKKREER